jgi:hypothetical protein
MCVHVCVHQPRRPKIGRVNTAFSNNWLEDAPPPSKSTRKRTALSKKKKKKKKK